MPHDELTPRSDSVSTESSGGSPPCGGNHSETSSGVHSNSSSENQQPRRSTSVDDLTTALEQSPRVQAAPWKSFSLQRNVQPPTNSVSSQPMYGFASANTLPSSSSMAVVPDSIPIRGCPAVLLENATENTVVIRRKQSRPKTTDGNQSTVMKDEPFGRSTNMRMTSFTDTSDGGRPDLENFPSSSSTLPHYPTQPVATAAYPHCSTMPLPSSSPASGSSHGSNSAGSGSCNLFPRQHTTIPTHHNGVRLFGGPSPFVKRFPLYHHQGINGRPHVVLAPVGPLVAMQANSGVEITSHHTFPQVAPILKFGPQQHLHKQDRDSAHFSMASSGDSDQYLPHS